MENMVNSFELGRVTLNGNKWGINPDIILSRIYCIKSGWAKIYTGSKERVLTAGNFYFFQQSSDFEIRDSENFDHIYFNITLRFPIAGDTFITMDPEDYFLKKIFDIADFFVKDNSRIFMHKTVKYTSSVSYILEALTDYIDKTYHIPRVDNHFVYKAVEMIINDPVNVTVASLATTLNVNEHHFIRSFKKKMAITPMHYIRYCRLSLALAFLKDGESVERTAEKCGYASSTAFIAAFKKHFGVSPKKALTIEYR